MRDAAPDPIVPDDKDWTWVLVRPCPECGLDASAVPVATIPDRLRDNAAAWAQLLAPAGDDVRRRPRPDRWSTLEYGAHVRDVFVRFRERLGMMMTEDDPYFPNWDQDATAVEARYGEQDPAVVAEELVAAADLLAADLAAVDGDGLQRTGRRSDGAHFTVESFAQYLLHDPVHHLWDVR